MPGADGRPAMVVDDAFWDDLDILASDEIIGVRISLARFIGILRGMYVYLIGIGMLSDVCFTSNSPVVLGFLCATWPSKSPEPPCRRFVTRSPIICAR